ncbi:hypothetical protein BXZ70DRAFT_911658 [Cristinia sonorae]|uniref:Uncharacterized protein n=1 Tax=Cristinia sonorae TaxID=1940300 RepID=A0A8K0UCL9_9AGAR|nr:hypothetical protein BXZ70DRAFT_911658 [Cristinia sonorae]
MSPLTTVSSGQHSVFEIFEGILQTLLNDPEITWDEKQKLVKVIIRSHESVFNVQVQSESIGKAHTVPSLIQTLSSWNALEPSKQTVTGLRAMLVCSEKEVYSAELSDEEIDQLQRTPSCNDEMEGMIPIPPVGSGEEIDGGERHKRRVLQAAHCVETQGAALEDIKCRLDLFHYQLRQIAEKHKNSRLKEELLTALHDSKIVSSQLSLMRQESRVLDRLWARIFGKQWIHNEQLNI